MTATTTVGRRQLPYPSGHQIEALQAILDAYYALNMADGQGGAHWAIESDNSPMDYVRRALIKALKLVPGVSQVAARRIFNACINNGESVQWNYDLWRVGSI